MARASCSSTRCCRCTRAPGPRLLRTATWPAARKAEASFDAVLLCTGHQAARLLRPLGLSLPIAPVYGYSVTAPLSQSELPTSLGPRGAVMDEKYKVAISRLGQRIRVAGSAELGGAPDRMNDAALRTLYKVLDDWFPGAARLSQASAWKGARPMLPDGPPVLGRSRSPGIWLNLGHGGSGWALSCGSARIVADLIGRPRAGHRHQRARTAAAEGLMPRRAAAQCGRQRHRPPCRLPS